MVATRHFQAPGSLPPPGPLGRLARLMLAVPCVWFLVAVLPPWVARAGQVEALGQLPWPWALVALYLTGYVVNIGFGLTWGRRPQLAVLLAMALGMLVGRWLHGDWLGPPVVWVIAAWLAYVYLHLAISFLLAAAFATPGCEMRALPIVLGRLRGRRAVEHECPVGPLAWLDARERAGRIDPPD